MRLRRPEPGLSRPASSTRVRQLRPLPAVLAMLAGLVVAGCGGSGGSQAMDEAVGKGNADQIRKDYAALPDGSAQGAEARLSTQSTPDPALPDPFAKQVADAVNQARSQRRRGCGRARKGRWRLPVLVDDGAGSAPAGHDQ